MKFSKEHDQQLLRMLHNKYGKEVTPAELVELRKQAYELLRRELVKKGVPALTDEQLLEVMRFFQKHVKNTERHGN